MHLHWREWQAIGASDTVVNWILEGVPLKFAKTPTRCDLPNHASAHCHASFVSSEIRTLLKRGCISQVDPKDRTQQVFCCMPLQVAPKRNGKLRLILDCRWVNQYISCPTFKQPGIDEVATQIEEGDILVSLDLESGFHHVKFNPLARKYVAFYWQGKFYMWRVLPFGIKCAPYYLYKILRPVISYLRNQGV